MIKERSMKQHIRLQAVWAIWLGPGPAFTSQNKVTVLDNCVFRIPANVAVKSLHIVRRCA